jgi:RimJ/RimL family protein N-acetyltransferase
MRYFEKLSGERLFLSPMNPDDYEQYTKWMNDPAVTVGLGNHPRLISLSSEKKFLESVAERNSSGDCRDFAMVLREGEEGRLIGNISLMGINGVDGTATLGLFIGEERDRSCGYGAEAMRLILHYGFDSLRLHNVQLHCNSDNARAIACYKKVGFKEFGRRRESKFHSGGYVDTVHMDILDSEFAR